MSRVDEEITTQQAAKIANVDIKTIRRWHHDGNIEGHQVPGGSRMPYLFSKKSLLSYLKQKSATKSKRT